MYLSIGLLEIHAFIFVGPVSLTLSEYALALGIRLTLVFNLMVFGFGYVISRPLILFINGFLFIITDLPQRDLFIY